MTRKFCAFCFFASWIFSLFFARVSEKNGVKHPGWKKYWVLAEMYNNNKMFCI